MADALGLHPSQIGSIPVAPTIFTDVLNRRVSEWLKELVLKTRGPRGSVGSNPTPSAIFMFTKTETFT